MGTNRIIVIAFVLIIVTITTQENVKKFKLHSGDLMPMVGFGTYLITGTGVIRDTLDYALGAGYRLIDTAKVYKNEEDIGKALKELLPKHNLTRQDIFITTKLAADDLGDTAYDSLKESIQKLDCDYIDLYLIHSPNYRKLNRSDPENAKYRDLSWQQLVKGVKANLTRNIGVSNYNTRHLKELLANDHGIKPAVNQVEYHPYFRDTELLELCQKEGILLQAYFSLGGTSKKTELLGNAEVGNIAKKLGKSPAQVLLEWALQQNVAVIPKSLSKHHIESNIDLNFEIPEDEMKILNSFEQRYLGRNRNDIT